MILITGISGAGKSTILEYFFKKYQNHLFLPTSNTTREPKERDKHSFKKYEYISEEIFKERINQDYFLEWEKVHSRYYGTPKECLKTANLQNKDILLDIDPKGAINLLKNQELYLDFKLKGFFIWRNFNPLLDDFKISDLTDSLKTNLLLRDRNSLDLEDLEERVKSSFLEYRMIKENKNLFTFIENDGVSDKAFIHINNLISPIFLE